MKDNILLKLSRKAYEDSVYACWIGKNIGGTIGTPYEGKREELDISGFATEAGAPLPNDDLDLQLVWLYNLEKIGSRALNCITLGESWLNLITPHWNEYGLGKINMKRGLIPPISGDYNNNWKDSNGAWIRTEIWACLAPACPDIAAKYSLEDARVDHGAGEGTMAAIFVATMQSAAFAVKDVRKCIEIGLSAIPEDCRVSDSIRCVIDCYDKGVAPRDTRNIILKRNADIGDGWFEAPSNVAYTVLGLLYGEGDFKKSIIHAVNCGDDTDCTAATVGATLGILGGTRAIPTDWKAHIGDDIITVSIKNDGPGRRLPKTCTQLTERVVAQTSHLLFDNDSYVEIVDGDFELPENAERIVRDNCNFIEVSREIKPFAVSFDTTFMKAELTLDEAPDVLPEQEKRVKVTVMNNNKRYDNCPYNITFRWWLADGFTLVSGKKTAVLRQVNSHSDGCVSAEFVLKAGEEVAAVNKCVLEICGEERVTPLYIPVTFLG